MEEEKKKMTVDAEEPAAKPRIRSEYSHLFEDNDEDPYEQIFRRVEDPAEESVGGIPTHKEQAVAGLFEAMDEPDEREKNWKLAAQLGDVLKKWPAAQRKSGAAAKKSATAEERAMPAEDVQLPRVQEAVQDEDESVIVFAPVNKSVPAETADTPVCVPDTTESETIAPMAEPAQSSAEPMILFGAEDAMSEPEPTEPEQTTAETGAAEENAAEDNESEAAEAAKEFLFAEVVPEEELTMHFKPAKRKPKVKAAKKKKTKVKNKKPEAEPTEPADEPVIVFEEAMPQTTEPETAPAESADEPVIVFEEEVPQTTEPEAEPTEPADEPVIVFEEEVPQTTEPETEPTEPAKEPEPYEPPATLPSWNIKVDIPEEIKDVEGKLKDIPVEDLPIHVFTEAQQEISEVHTQEVPIPTFDGPPPEEKKPEPAAEPENTPEPEQMELPQEEAEVQEPEPAAEPEPPQPICIKWSEDTFRPYRGKEIVIPASESFYAPVEQAYQQIVAPIRKKRKQARRRKKRQELMQLLKEAAVETAVHTKDRTVACAKKTAHSLRPSVVYNRIKHLASSTADTRAYLVSAILQMIIAGLGGLVLLALLIVNKYDIPLQVELSQYKVPVLFASIHAIAMGAAMLFSFRMTTGGTVSLFTRHCDRGTDGLVSLLMWFCLAQSVLSIFFPQEILQGRVSLYAPICMLVLFMDAWGKLVNFRRVRRIRQMLAQNADVESAGVLPEDTELQARIDANVPDRLTVIREPQTDRAAVVRNATERDGSQKIMRIVTYPLLAVAVLIGALAFVVEGSWMGALSACTCALCACAPLSVSLCMTLPAARAAKRMQKYGAAAASWEAVASFGEVGCAVVRDEDFYPDGAVKLMNVKVIREPLLESAVVAAAAVLHQVGGPLRKVFDRILTGEASAMPKAERVHVEENGGAAGWVGGIRVVLGNGETLKKYNIQAPSRDYERKNCPEGQQFVYLASGGDLVAMFILAYQVEPEVKQAVQALSDTGCDLAVCTADVNLTKTFLAGQFDIEEEGVELLRDVHQEQGISEADSRDQLVLTQGGRSLFAGLKICISAKGAMELAAALQFAGILLGILLMVVFAATGSVYQLSNLVVALFELFWLTAVVLIPALRRM